MGPNDLDPMTWDPIDLGPDDLGPDDLDRRWEAQGRGFAHGHEKHHSEPRDKAIDMTPDDLGPD